MIGNGVVGHLFTRRAVWLAAALAVTSLLFSACGTTGAANPTLSVAAGDDMHYHPASLTVKAGTATTIIFTNGAATVSHDLVSEGAERNVRLINVGPSRQQRGTFQASRPGTYEFYCTQPGHRELGMTGTIVVTP